MLAGRSQADAVGGHVEAVAETYQQVLRAGVSRRAASSRSSVQSSGASSSPSRRPMTSRAGAGRRRKRLIFASICHADASRPRRISATLSWVRPSLTGTWPTRHSPRISNVPAQARARASRPIWARSRQGSRRRPSSNHRSRQRRERSALRAAPAMPARRRLPIRRPAPPGRLRYRRGRRRSDSGAVRFVCRRVARRAAPGPGRAHRPGRPPGRWPSAAAPRFGERARPRCCAAPSRSACCSARQDCQAPSPASSAGTSTRQSSSLRGWTVPFTQPRLRSCCR